MQTVEQFLGQLGGTVAVARALDLAPTTVSSWKTAGSIPKWRMEALERLAVEKKVKVPRKFAPPAQPDTPTPQRAA